MSELNRGNLHFFRKVTMDQIWVIRFLQVFLDFNSKLCPICRTNEKSYEFKSDKFWRLVPPICNLAIIKIAITQFSKCVIAILIIGSHSVSEMHYDLNFIDCPNNVVHYPLLSFKVFKISFSKMEFWILHKHCLSNTSDN